MENLPWTEKYRPQKLEEIVQDGATLSLLAEIVRTRKIPHFLFYGSSGTGKTTTILTIGREIFGEHFSQRVIEFNASDDRGINAVREKITLEAKKYVHATDQIPGYKIIVLDEADSMTEEAQDALRVIIEEYSRVTRFCFICNYISKISEAIRSRCTLVYFKRLDEDLIVRRLQEIGRKESLNLDPEVYRAIIDISEGDLRKSILHLQNLKYLYDYKNFARKPISDDLGDLSILRFYRPPEDQRITPEDVYRTAVQYMARDSLEMLRKVLECQNMGQVVNLARELLTQGYPVDNMILQTNRVILSQSWSVDQRTRIIEHSGRVLQRLRNGGHEFLALLDYLATIYQIHSQKLTD
jgi:replication factor C subunit 2/4